MRWTSIGSRWSATTGAARSPGRRRSRAIPRIERLAIVNSPHPLIFQKSLIEDEAQRAASQYIRAFRDPHFEKFVEGIGFEAFFDKSFSKHVDLAVDPGRGTRASTSRNGAVPAR